MWLRRSRDSPLFIAPVFFTKLHFISHKTTNCCGFKRLVAFGPCLGGGMIMHQHPHAVKRPKEGCYLWFLLWFCVSCTAAPGLTENTGMTGRCEDPRCCSTPPDSLSASSSLEAEGFRSLGISSLINWRDVVKSRLHRAACDAGFLRESFTEPRAPVMLTNPGSCVLFPKQIVVTFTSLL